MLNSYLVKNTQAVKSLRTIYTFRQPLEVLEFLCEHVASIPLLKKTHEEIRKYFESEELVLDVVTDPEAENEKELMVFVQTSRSPEDAIDELERLLYDLWPHTSSLVEKPSIHVEFK